LPFTKDIDNTKKLIYAQNYKTLYGCI